MKYRSKRHGKRHPWMNAVLSVVIVLLAGFLCWLLTHQPQPQRDVEEQSQAIRTSVLYNGVAYKYNTNLTNILFLGIDKEENITELHLPSDSGQCDFLAVLSLNKETREARILQINRNTMTNLDFYDMFGNYSRSMDGQIALQYAFNIGGSSSCWATKKTVQELLMGVPMDAVLAMDISSVPLINDLLGGITVTMRRDYTYIDPAFAAGEKVQLKGTQAEQFVRYRDITQFNSIEDRMSRQMDYLTGLIAVITQYSGSQLYSLMEPYLETVIVTDMTAELAKSLPSYRYITDDIACLPGEEIMGETYEEFILDEAGVRQLVLKLFYVEK